VCSCTYEVSLTNIHCHFSVFTQLPTHSEIGTTLDTTTRIPASTNNNLPTEQAKSATQPNDLLSNKTNPIIIIVSVGLGLFLLLFGILVGVYIHKSLHRNVGRITDNERTSKEEHSYTPIRHQAQIQVQQTTSQTGNICENSAYLTPVNEEVDQYDDADVYDYPDESLDGKGSPNEPFYSDTANNEPDPYLTPSSVAQHVYVEVLE
jgi:hypothetical protein